MTFQQQYAQQCIERGCDFPYDDIEETRYTGNDPAKIAVYAVLQDLRGRSGIGNELQDLDNDIKHEIVETLTTIVQTVYERRKQMTELDPQWKRGRDECLHLLAQYHFENQNLTTDEYNNIKQKQPLVITTKYFELEAQNTILKRVIDHIKDLQPGRIENGTYIPNIKGIST